MPALKPTVTTYHHVARQLGGLGDVGSAVGGGIQTAAAGAGGGVQTAVAGAGGAIQTVADAPNAAISAGTGAASDKIADEATKQGQAYLEATFGPYVWMIKAILGILAAGVVLGLAYMIYKHCIKGRRSTKTKESKDEEKRDEGAA